MVYILFPVSYLNKKLLQRENTIPPGVSCHCMDQKEDQVLPLNMSRPLKHRIMAGITFTMLQVYNQIYKRELEDWHR